MEKKAPKWQCVLGMHRWKETGNKTRECRKCGEKQYWVFGNFFVDGHWQEDNDDKE